jgi:hypothetical protein
LSTDLISEVGRDRRRRRRSRRRRSNTGGVKIPAADREGSRARKGHSLEWQAWCTEA